MALSKLYPEARSVWAWVKAGWHIALGYVVGYLVMLTLVGWHPHPINDRAVAASVAPTSAAPAVFAR